jgi:hypothetical protein
MVCFLLPDRLTVQRYHDFLETVLPGQWASSCAAEGVILAWQTSSPLRGRRLAVVKHDASKKVEWMLRTNSMASSVTGSNSNGFFPYGVAQTSMFTQFLPRHHRSWGKTSSSCDNGQCWHVEAYSKERTLCSTLPCALKWTEAPLICNLVAPIDRPSDKPVPNDYDVYLEN